MSLWTHKLRAFAIHLAISLAVAALAALLVFGVWYPYPYREISGGRELFLLIVAVDVVLGPLITFTVYNPAKSRREKRLDFSIVGLIQIAALLYGLWTVFQARPVHTVFEYDRLRVVHAVDVPRELLGKAPPGITALPVTGPTLLSLRPMSVQENVEMTIAALGGVSLSARPELWQTYEAGRAAVLTAARPAAELPQRFPAQSAEIARAVARTGRAAEALAYLPVAARKDTFWTALIDRQDARVLTYLPLDSF